MNKISIIDLPLFISLRLYHLIILMHDHCSIKLAFSLNTQLGHPPLAVESAITLDLILTYEGYKLDVNINIDGTQFSGCGDSLENAFIELSQSLSKTNQTIRSCFTCALSGYEKGGSTLLCLKENRTELLAVSYINGYNNWFGGLNGNSVSEIQSA